MMGREWYVVNTHPQGGARAEFNLPRRGFIPNVPRYLRKRRHARREDIAPRALFSRYLFGAVDLTRDRWRAIQSTFGVSHHLSAGDVPLVISESMVEESCACEGVNGFVRLGLGAGLGPGGLVRLSEGIFAEYRSAIDRIADDRRVAVLLELLGREVRVFAPAASLGTV